MHKTNSPQYRQAPDKAAGEAATLGGSITHHDGKAHPKQHREDGKEFTHHEYEMKAERNLIEDVRLHLPEFGPWCGNKLFDHMCENNTGQRKSAQRIHGVDSVVWRSNLHELTLYSYSFENSRVIKVALPGLLSSSNPGLETFMLVRIPLLFTARGKRLLQLIRLAGLHHAGRDSQSLRIPCKTQVPRKRTVLLNDYFGFL